jgi:3-phosphoshikimate 1-carboxyvinyltransferase
MNLVVQPATSISGEIEPPPSKLYTQVACALALLAEGKSTIEAPLRAKDTVVMFRAAEAFGATVKRTQERLSLWGTGGGLKPAQSAIDARNSGTVAGLLTSVATLATTPTVINGDVQLRSRPMSPLLKALRQLGADVHSTKPDESPPFVVFGGGLRGGKVRLEGAEARFLPAILLPTPYAKAGVEVSIPPAVRPKLEPVVKLMRTARARMIERRGTISILNQPYHSFNYRVERELAGAAPFIVAAGLLSSSLKLRGVREISPRDAAFLQTLRSFGLRVHRSGRMIEVEGKDRLRGVKLDLSWAPELLPLMAVLSCAASGRTVIRNAGDARAMKSDRISATVRELRRMGARALEQVDGLVVQGPARLRGCEVDGHDDYAVVSALVVAGLLAEGKTVIKNGADALATSYSRFLSNFQNLGAEVNYSS